ncbi:hypothetical protein [Paenibacillus sp. R14(2021)]|uniref:hypothetical protein n=1 Tax=Paenibacillus sp. R14(2021) TaxID=2859228 RepID=UPI001C61513D|nr:hypothetical protein [Paenibacillus sp. R14(2021)]
MLQSMGMKAFSSVLLVWLALLSMLPGAASAASVKLTDSAQAALTKHIAAAAPAMKERLNTQTQILQSYQTQENGLDSQYSALHAANGKALEAVRQRIKLVDAQKLNRMTQEVAALREHYKPLLTLYTSLNERIADARALKLKALTAMLKEQADALKPAVQIARAEIRWKEDQLKAAKAATAKTVKALKANLTEIEPLRDQTKSVQAVVSGTKKNIPSVVKTLNAAVKAGSHEGSLQSLNTLSSLARTIVEQKGRIITFENRISGIISQTNALIPSK